MAAVPTYPQPRSRPLALVPVLVRPVPAPVLARYRMEAPRSALEAILGSPVLPKDPAALKESVVHH